MAVYDRILGRGRDAQAARNLLSPGDTTQPEITGTSSKHRKWGLPVVSIADRGEGPSAQDYQMGQSGGPVQGSADGPSNWNIGDSGMPTVSGPRRGKQRARYVPQMARRNENSGESRTDHFSSGYDDSRG